MNEPNNNWWRLAPQSYRFVPTILTVLYLLFTLFVCGTLVHEAIVAREPDSDSGPSLALPLTLCIVGAAGFFALRVFQLRRAEQPVPTGWHLLLIGTILIMSLINLDHFLWRAPLLVSSRPDVWEVLVKAIFSLFTAAGLAPAAEVLPGQLKALQLADADRRQAWKDVLGELRKFSTDQGQAWQEVLAEVDRRSADLRQLMEGLGTQVAIYANTLRALQSIQQQVGQPQQQEPAPQNSEPEVAPPPSAPAPPPHAWEVVWQRAAGRPFDVELVQEVFGKGKTVAYKLLQVVQERNLVQKVAGARYTFTVRTVEDLRAWIKREGQ